jgi:hypothetical protein
MLESGPLISEEERDNGNKDHDYHDAYNTSDNGSHHQHHHHHGQSQENLTLVAKVTMLRGGVLFGYDLRASFRPHSPNSPPILI